MREPREERARGRAAARLAAAMCILHVPLAACEDNTSHPYPAREYRADRDCLAAPIAIDVVEGEDPGACAPVCLVKAEDGGRAAYVSTTCAPYPPFVDTSGSDPRCALALAALERSDLCLSDGGSRSPRDAARD
jgi:hypothetical protein